MGRYEPAFLNCSCCDSLVVASGVGCCINHSTQLLCRPCAQQHDRRNHSECLWALLREGAGLQQTAFWPHEETV